MLTSRAYLLILLMIPYSALATSLPERITQFVNLFDNREALASYDIRSLQTDFPTKLLAPEFMLPQTADYPLKDMQLLYQLSENCAGRIPLSPLVTEPLVFVRAMCRSTPLPTRWFARTGLIHPGGGTYAYRYSDLHPEDFDQLQAYMHIQERPLNDEATLLGRLQRMLPDALAALIAGEKMFVDGDMLWLRQGNRYLLYPAGIWQAHSEEAELSYTLLAQDSECLVRRGNLCWSEQDNSQLMLKSIVAMVVLNILLVIGWVLYRWNVKKNELKSRMLVLQILTHELRTPIASLSLTVEGFRRDFESLPENLHDKFRRLCEDSRRLRQLAEASKDYLQSDHQTFATEWIPSIDEWLHYRYEEYGTPIQITLSDDIAAKLNIYWLGNCLDNLVNNAIKYGVEPIELKVETKDNQITFYVIDQGLLTQKDWKQVKKPFVSEAGLGLGLTIVDSMVSRMGGKMSLQGPPTSFKLEIPCETDTATR